jgi:hypothetical protein
MSEDKIDAALAIKMLRDAGFYAHYEMKRVTCSWPKELYSHKNFDATGMVVDRQPIVDLIAERIAQCPLTED